MLKIDTPPSIVAEQQELAIALKEQPKFQSLEDMHRWALFHLGNPLKGKDGRTYIAVTPDGKYISRFVSQFSELIDDNIEPKIKPVIKALHDRGYLTFGSCQGHPEDPNERRRWFGVCFASAQSRQKFIDDLKAVHLPLSFWTEIATPSTHSKRGLRLRLSYKQDSEAHTQEELTKYWNIMFCRNYSQYFPLGVGICCDLSGADKWLVELKYYFHRRKLEPVTWQLAEAIKKLPEYVDV